MKVAAHLEIRAAMEISVIECHSSEVANTRVHGCAAVMLPLIGQNSTPEVCPQVGETTEPSPEDALDPGFLVICWDDPVNLMDYVTHVFQKVFGWNRQKAEHHMLEVHHLGKSVLTCDSLERAEYYVHQLHCYHLHATLEQAR